ncbi:MAG: hypothetical protein DRH08_00220 [Deltaproteobacteria bacterium]|nr:MAG: hypothetical protein DRH08_00220 [Deltaproteobacteria bacterium]
MSYSYGLGTAADSAVENDQVEQTASRIQNAEVTEYVLPKEMSSGAVISLGLAVTAAVGLIGFLAYQRMKITQAVVKQHGVGGALMFEGGMGLIGSMSRNKKRKRRSSKRRRRTSR